MPQTCLRPMRRHSRAPGDSASCGNCGARTPRSGGLPRVVQGSASRGSSASQTTRTATRFCSTSVARQFLLNLLPGEMPVASGSFVSDQSAARRYPQWARERRARWVPSLPFRGESLLGSSDRLAVGWAMALPPVELAAHLWRQGQACGDVGRARHQTGWKLFFSQCRSPLTARKQRFSPYPLPLNAPVIDRGVLFAKFSPRRRV